MQPGDKEAFIEQITLETTQNINVITSVLSLPSSTSLCPIWWISQFRLLVQSIAYVPWGQLPNILYFNEWCNPVKQIWKKLIGFFTLIKLYLNYISLRCFLKFHSKYSISIKCIYVITFQFLCKFEPSTFVLSVLSQPSTSAKDCNFTTTTALPPQANGTCWSVKLGWAWGDKYC